MLDKTGFVVLDKAAKANVEITREGFERYSDSSVLADRLPSLVSGHHEALEGTVKAVPARG